jgi:hypothetical protein
MLIHVVVTVFLTINGLFNFVITLLVVSNSAIQFTASHCIAWKFSSANTENVFIMEVMYEQRAWLTKPVPQQCFNVINTTVLCHYSLFEA